MTRALQDAMNQQPDRAMSAGARIGSGTLGRLRPFPAFLRQRLSPLQLYYRPRVGLRAGTASRMEALVRMPLDVIGLQLYGRRSVAHEPAHPFL